jgi:phytoene synthase
MDGGQESSVAQAKLRWWGEEMLRLAGGAPSTAPAHPISRYLAALPGAEPRFFAPLATTVEAVSAQVAGVPLEETEDLEPHADALYGAPLRVVAALTGAALAEDEARAGDVAQPALRTSIAALACGTYLARACVGYRRDARSGRIPFPVSELLAAGIDNAALQSIEPSAALAEYLAHLGRRAAACFERAATLLPPADRPAQRHLAVLAALGRRRSDPARSSRGTDFRPADLYNAWIAARRAASGR